MQPRSEALYVILKSPIKAGTEPTFAAHVHILAALKEGSKDMLCFQTDKPYMINGELTGIDDRSFAFTDWSGRVWEMKEVNLQEFRRLNGNKHPAIKTTADLWELYRNKYPQTFQI